MSSVESTNRWAGYRFVGGNLALDFVNTAANRLAPAQPIEYLRKPADLLHWVRLAGFEAGGRAEVSLRHALRLREAIYKILAARLRGTPPGRPDVQLLDRSVRRARAAWKLRAATSGWRWQWAGPPGPSYALARVAESAAELLTSADLKRLRQCSDSKCGWLFLDRSHGRRRKWCSMQDCGNRAKVRRFFAKKT